MMTNPTFDECARMTDLLNCEKHMTGIYNTFLCETETASVRSCFAEMLTDEHRMQESLFAEMKSRGWYQTQQAEEQKLQAAKQKFCQ